MTGRFPLVQTAAAMFLAACAHDGAYVWGDRLPGGKPLEPVIQVGDMVQVKVAQQDQISATTRVRSDGRISMALISDVEVAGMTPSVASEHIQKALEGFVVNPQVSVFLEARAPLKVAVLGQVNKPGMFEVDASHGVLHALAAAGGLTEYADTSRIYVLRQAEGRTQRIRFSLDMLSQGTPRFAFQPGDVILVQE